MRVLLLVTLATMGLACSRAGAPSSPAWDTRGTIFVGQPWAEATATARRAGYELHDASQLAMHPTPDGFNVSLIGRRALIVYRDPERDAVEAISWVENWHEKAFRVYYSVDAFELPPADPAAP